MKKKEISALERLDNNVIAITPQIYYRCPDCKDEMICEYDFTDSHHYIICLKCKKVYILILKEVNKKLNL